MQYRNVLCVYPYQYELKTVGFLPPLGLELIASAIEDMVDRIDIIDLRYETQPLDTFLEGRDLVLVSINWEAEMDFIRQTIDRVPEGVTVVAGGRHATENVEELLEDMPRIDAIVRGDGEEVSREIMKKGLTSEVDGLSFRSDGKVMHNKNRKLEAVHSEYYPNRKLRRYSYYVTLDEFNTNLQIDMMLGSRGCPYNCKFCDFKFNPLGEKRKWSSRTPESVVAELKTVDADVVAFADDIFTADMNWVDRVCDLILEAGIRKKYVINARLELAKRPDVLNKMYKAGFMGFLLGIESAHDKTLASMNKGFDTAKIREYFEVLRQFNFIYHCYFIIGNIGETREEMLETITFARELGVDTLGLSVLRATKYSPLKEIVKDLDDYHIEQESGKVYSDHLSAEELQQIRRDVNASFFTTPVILRILKKMILHRLLTVGLVNKLIVYTARRKVKKMAANRHRLMGNVVR
ncbi:MAG: radical SAM protein [Thermodesulfobacteriota bacterium]|nr:radical SAM protein [Thermodesulfobacteriota bacterium]